MPAVIPQQYAGLIRQAEACLRSGRKDEAERALVEVVRINPREHFAWSLLASLALQRGDTEIALAHIRRALELDRRSAGYLNLYGVALGESRQLDAAEAALRRALRQQPTYAEAHYNLGKVLQKKGDLAGARVAYRRAVSLDPRYPGARDNLALVLYGQGDLQGALDVLESAMADEPDDPSHRRMLAHMIMVTRGYDAAIALYEEACRSLPQSAELHWYLAHLLLAVGNFRRGWDERLLGRAGVAARALPGAPQKLPERLEGQDVFLVSEEGLGDILFFLRFVPLLAARGARVSIRAPDKMVALLRASGRFERVLAESTSDPLGGEADFRVLTGELPFALECERTVAPFALATRAELEAGWRQRLARLGPPPYAGVTWRGGTDVRQTPEFGRGARLLFKEIGPEALGAALRLAPGTLVSLQRLPAAGETEKLAAAVGRPVHDFSAVNDDLESMLALLAVLDEYVAVSNTNLHLRAGIGRVSRVLVQFPPEWRWMAAGDESPWFPGCRVYREAVDDSWDGALAALAADLAGMGEK